MFLFDLVIKALKFQLTLPILYKKKWAAISRFPILSNFLEMNLKHHLKTYLSILLKVSYNPTPK